MASVDKPVPGKRAADGPPEGELLPAQRMDLLGRLAGSIAHDFNNLLTIISGHASLLLDAEALPAASGEALRRIFTASQQASGLFHQLQLASGGRPPELEVVDLNAEVERAAGSLRPLMGEGVAVEVEPSPDSPRVRADAAMLEQLLINLAVNARDAMGRRGRLTVAVALRRLRADDLRGRPGARAGDFACLCVRDTGRGIPAPVLPRIFEPFFTTKGEGIGIGLSSARDIATRHDGWIEVESEVARGTEFRIYLPLTRAEPAPVPEPGRGAGPGAPKATLLLVEDEAGVREFAAAVLRQDGYKLLQAKSGENALEVWRWHSARIDLLLTDVVLPGDLSGPQLGARLQAEKPALRVILATGHGPGAAEPGGFPHRALAKPYSPRSLLKAVRDALA